MFSDIERKQRHGIKLGKTLNYETLAMFHNSNLS